MFDTIAPTYDRANHLLTAGIDRTWWTRTARRFQTILERPESVVLDLCCGTGDMTMALLRHRPAAANAAPILAVDFSHQMLALGVKKFGSRNVIPIEADALHLPIPDASVDLVTSAFGFRNLANYQDGLAEIRRVLRPGGRFGILECNQPEGRLRRNVQRLLPIDPPEARWPHQRQHIGLQLPELLGRALPPPTPHGRN